jgi:hypothetical protein
MSSAQYFAVDLLNNGSNDLAAGAISKTGSLLFIYPLSLKMLKFTAGIKF